MAAGTYRGGRAGRRGNRRRQPVPAEGCTRPSRLRVRDHEIEGGDEDVDDRSHGGAATTSERSRARGALTSTSGAPLSSSGTAPVAATSSTGTDGASPHQGREIPKLPDQRRAAPCAGRAEPREGRRVATVLLPAPPLHHHRQQKARAILFLRFCRRELVGRLRSRVAPATDFPIAPVAIDVARAASFAVSPAPRDTMLSSSAAWSREATDPCDPPSQDRRPSQAVALASRREIDGLRPFTARHPHEIEMLPLTHRRS